LSLDAIPRGARVFLDASVFLGHFTGLSRECRGLLERCERAEVRGVTSALVLAEVVQRLLLLEAVAAGHLGPGESAARLRDRPEALQKLHVHEDAAAAIPLMGVEVRPLDLRALLAASAIRRRAGLLTRAALVAASAREAGLEMVASAEADLERAEGLKVYRPADLAP
jgi:predicted nucleic acid-binding protein